MLVSFSSKSGPSTKDPREEADELMTLISRMQVSPKVVLMTGSRQNAKEQTTKSKRAEEHRLCALAQAGDIDARNELISSHMWLVDYTMKTYFRGRIREEADDMRSEGVLGLIKAISAFDPTKADALSTYAMFWIRAFMSRGRKKHRDYDKAPDGSRIKSLSAPITVDGHEDLLLEDVLRDTSMPLPDDSLSDKKIVSSVRSAVFEWFTEYSKEGTVVVGLKDRKLVAAIIKDRLLSSEPKSLKEVGETLGYSRENARLYEERMLDILRKRLQAMQIDLKVD